MLNFLTCISTTFSKQAVKALARPCVCAWVDQEGTGVQTPPPPPPPPLKNHNTIGFPSNTGPDPQRSVTFMYMIYGFVFCIIFWTKSTINIKTLLTNIAIKLLIDRIEGELAT